MERPKNSTRARRILIAKTPTHRLRRIAEDRAPTKARNSRKALRILEKNNSWIDNQEEWDESGKEEDLSTESDSSSIICLDRGDEEDVHLPEPTNLNTVLFTGLANWQKSVAEKLASNKRPRHDSGRSLRTMYRRNSCQWKPPDPTRFEPVDSWMPTGLDWMGHRRLGHAGSTVATAHCPQTLFGMPDHAFE